MPEDCVLEADSSDASPPHQVLNISNFIESNNLSCRSNTATGRINMEQKSDPGLCTSSEGSSVK